MAEEMPPSPVPPTAEDRRTFRERTIAALKAAGVSQRQAERNIGMPRGTISKIYAGRVVLTLKVLLEIAAQARVEPQTLVDGTGLARILLGSPESPRSDELARAVALADELRAELAARDATVMQLTEQLLASRSECAAVRRSEGEARQMNVDLQGRIEGLSAQAHESTQLARRNLSAVAQQRDQAVAEVAARLTETEKQVAAWRSFATERGARVTYLETEMRKGLAAAGKRSSDEAGRLLLTAITALGVGAVFGRDT